MQTRTHFQKMENSYFSFQALTRIYVGLPATIPEGIRGDLREVRKFIMDNDSGSRIEIPFTGTVEIFRGKVAKNPITNEDVLHMLVTSMEEYGYSKELNTTFKLSAQAENKSFGVTHKFSKHIETPADIRLLLNLEVDAIGGDLQGVVVKEKCTTKSVKAIAPDLPFTSGTTVFRHVGDEALVIGRRDDPIAYLANGFMVPQLSLDERPHPEVMFNKADLPDIADLSAEHFNFLYGS